MKIKLKLLAVLMMLALLVPLGVVSANGIPQLPVFFYGDASEAGFPADVGTVVSVHVDTTQVASFTTTVEGEYNISVPYQGDTAVTVVFKLDGIVAGEWTGIVNGWNYPLGVPLDLSTEAPVIRYGLTISVEPPEGGDVTEPGEGSFTYDAGTVVDLVAVANTGYRFTQWSGNVSAIGDRNAATTNITMNNPYSITANFVKLPAMQLAMLLDSSGSIGLPNWDIMTAGLASAVSNSACLPQDGTVELTVVRFSDSASVVVGPVVITSSNAASVASAISAIGYLGDMTNTADAFDVAADALVNSDYFSPTVKQAINLVTDGDPTYPPGVDPVEAAETARDNAIETLEMTEDQDEIDAEGIGIIDANRDWLRDSIVYPQPGYIAPPFDQGPGWVRVVSDADEFADTICEKLKMIICVPAKADFTAAPRRGEAPLKVRFTDKSTGEVTEWSWDFGDGNTSTLQNPFNTYIAPGSYDVSLEVGDCGSDTETKTNYITVLEVEVVPALPPEPAKIGASYLFINAEQIVPSQWVEISANIYNRGGVKKSHTVVLYINGYLAQSQTIGVSPGGTELVVFRVRADSEFLGGIYTGPGTYTVNVEGMEGQFFVLAPAAAAPAGITGPLGTGGIIAIVVVVIVLIGGLIFGLRRE